MERAKCIVPGCCNSSAKFAGYRYICGPHWRLIPKWLKRRDRAVIRAFNKRGEIADGRGTTLRARAILNMSWHRLERAAIHAAAGI